VSLIESQIKEMQSNFRVALEKLKLIQQNNVTERAKYALWFPSAPGNSSSADFLLLARTDAKKQSSQTQHYEQKTNLLLSDVRR
jgi:hypothetical protein